MAQDGHHHLVVDPSCQVQVVWHALNSKSGRKTIKQLIHLFKSLSFLYNNKECKTNASEIQFFGLTRGPDVGGSQCGGMIDGLCPGHPDCPGL